MNQELLNFVSRSSLKDRPAVKVGQTVKVYQKIKEGEKQRIQTFQGLVLKVNGKKGINQTMTVRTTLSGVGVEKIFPLHTDTVDKIEVVKQSKVRRAKLYYMRERSGKSARLKEIKLGSDVLNQVHEASGLHPEIEELYQAQITPSPEEAPKEEAKQEEAPKEEAKQEEAPKEEAKQEEALKEEAKQEEAPKEEAKQEEAPKEEAKQEEAPKEEAKQEEAPKEDEEAK